VLGRVIRVAVSAIARSLQTSKLRSIALTMKRGAWIVILLLPTLASAESQLAPLPRNDVSHATAHVDFKIVIPSVLYLQVGNTMTIATNSRSVTFSSDFGNRIVAAARRHLIVEQTQCSYRAIGAAATCTVAAP